MIENKIKIDIEVLKSNGKYSIMKDVYEKDQHPNQQGGLNLYVGILDHSTGNVNTVKLYENSKGVYFKKNGNYYLKDFSSTICHIPYQVLKLG